MVLRHSTAEGRQRNRTIAPRGGPGGDCSAPRGGALQAFLVFYAGTVFQFVLYKLQRVASALPARLFPVLVINTVRNSTCKLCGYPGNLFIWRIKGKYEKYRSLEEIVISKVVFHTNYLQKYKTFVNFNQTKLQGFSRFSVQFSTEFFT